MPKGVDRLSVDGAGAERKRPTRTTGSPTRSPRTDVISGGALFIFALAYGFGASGLANSGDPAVALVPIGLAAALALLAAGIALSGWRKLRCEGAAEGRRTAQGAIQDAVPASAGPGSVHARLWTRRPGPTRAWTVIALTILYAGLFQTLGYVLATLLYTAAVAERFGARRRTILLLAPCVTLLTFLLFRVILGARLPAGILG